MIKRETNSGLSPTITTCGGHTEPKIMEKIDVIGNQMPSGHSAGRIINPNGIAPTVMGNHGTITKVVEVIQKPRGKNKGFKKEMGVCPTITSNAFEQNVLLGVDTSAMGAGGGQVPMHNYSRRVRKLTERECWRLMGVKDEDYEKVAAGQSKSSMYHLAGDSIVTAVLMALFGELLGIEWQSKVKDLADKW